MKNLNAIAVLLAACAAGTALANPRDSVTVTNLNSDAPNNGGTAVLTSLNTYVAKYARIQGTLTKTSANSFAREAVVLMLPPNGQIPSVLATTSTAAFNGSINVDKFVRLQGPVNANGVWNLFALETYDDAAGPDARWDTLTVTLNDGPPASTDLGALTVGTISHHQPLAAGQDHWYRFDLQGDVNGAALTFLDIDTEGTLTSQSSDVEIALFDADGRVLGYNDDGGSGLQAKLSYGAGTRPAVGNGTAYNGSDGALLAGTYYLVVRGLVGNAAQIGWDFGANSSNRTGDVRVNIRTNTGTIPGCPVDFNRDGILHVQDLFDYMNAWFAGCP